MTDKKDGRFTKRTSGNPNGRPRGSKNKAMTDKQVMDYLGKRTQANLEAIERLAGSTENDQLAFKCLNGLISFDFQLRASEYKKWLDKERLKIQRGEHSPTQDDKEEDFSAPVISLTAVSTD